jgi:hypothetical protein
MRARNRVGVQSFIAHPLQKSECPGSSPPPRSALPPLAARPATSRRSPVPAAIRCRPHETAPAPRRAYPPGAPRPPVARPVPRPLFHAIADRAIFPVRPAFPRSPQCRRLRRRLASAIRRRCRLPGSADLTFRASTDPLPSSQTLPCGDGAPVHSRSAAAPIAAIGAEEEMWIALAECRRGETAVAIEATEAAERRRRG